MNDIDRIAEIRNLITTRPEGMLTANKVNGKHCVTVDLAAWPDAPDDRTTVTPLAYTADEATAIRIARTMAAAEWLLDQMEQARAERDRAISIAVKLEQDLAAAEAARKAWTKTTDELLGEVRAELEHERSLSRHHATKHAALATAIGRVREAATAQGADAPEVVQQVVGRILRALDGEAPDGN